MNIRGLATTSESGYVSEHIEEWRAVVGYEGRYEISSLGRVWSCVRRCSYDNRSRLVGGYLLKITPGNRGYLVVSLWIDNRMELMHVHRLVCEAFRGPRPSGLEVRHLDGNPLNNCLDNLLYGTPAENSQDMLRHGRSNYASRTHCKHGHEFTAENTTPRTRGSSTSRVCRTCERDRQVRFHLKRREAAA